MEDKVVYDLGRMEGWTNNMCGAITIRSIYDCSNMAVNRGRGDVEKEGVLWEEVALYREHRVKTAIILLTTLANNNG